jgi:hypothetical protein
MMNMSFDDLRNEVAPASRSTALPGGARSGSMLMMDSRGTMMGGGVPMLMSGSSNTQPVIIPDHTKELQVSLFGPGAERFARSADISRIDDTLARAACKGKRDFILFEPLDNAVRERKRIVIVMELRASSSEISRAQVYLASSLARWLGEQKTDGSGRPYGESKDEDPTLRKHFTRAQITAIMDFADLDGEQ